MLSDRLEKVFLDFTLRIIPPKTNRVPGSGTSDKKVE